MPKSITAAQAAQAADVSRQQVNKDIAAGKLQAAKADPSKKTSTWLIPFEAFQAWLKTKKKRAQAPKA